MKMSTRPQRPIAKFFFAAALALTTALAYAPVAEAGCPEDCEFHDVEIEISPDLECLSTEAPSESSCYCSFSLQLTNECDATIEPADPDELTSCRDEEGERFHECHVLDPGESGVVSGPTSEERTTAEHEFEHDGTDHVLSITSRTEYTRQAGCSTTGTGPAGQLPWLLALFVLAMLALQRSRRKLSMTRDFLRG